MIQLYLALGLLGFIFYSKNKESTESFSNKLNIDYDYKNFNKKFNKAYNKPKPTSEAEAEAEAKDNLNFKQKFRSNLTGQTITRGDFLKNDRGDILMPHFKSKLTQSTNIKNDARILENSTANLYSCKKTELPAFFKPNKNLDVIRGTKNQSDLFEERMYITNKRNLLEHLQQIGRVKQFIIENLKVELDLLNDNSDE